MKLKLKLAVILLFPAVCAHAADNFRLPASKEGIEFPHRMHQEMLHDCFKCHEKGPGKIDNLGKEWAHNTCRKCHQELKRGPVKCEECHKL